MKRIIAMILIAVLCMMGSYAVADEEQMRGYDKKNGYQYAMPSVWRTTRTMPPI